jgi:hypothetical protein
MIARLRCALIERLRNQDRAACRPGFRLAGVVRNSDAAAKERDNR